jgi:hypothetical protein
MGFLKKLFGSDSGSSPGDDEGFFVYVQCNNCGDKVRLRIHKQHDLNRDDDGFVWHKTIIDSRCFRPIKTVAHFDGRYQMTTVEIDGGRYITQAEYEAAGSLARDQEADES